MTEIELNRYHNLRDLAMDAHDYDAVDTLNEQIESATRAYMGAIGDYF